MPRLRAPDPWLFGTTLLLVLSGLIMVGSASTFLALDQHGSASAFLVRHAVHVLVGFVVFAAALAVRYRDLDGRWQTFLFVGASAAGLILVLLMPAVGGARRWIPLGPLTLQPSEFTKLAVVVFVAWLLSRRQERIHDPFAVLVPCAGVVITLGLLIVVEPDLGTAVMLGLITAGMLFVAGLAWRHLITLAAAGTALIAVSVVLWPYRLRRLLAFWDPDADPQGASFQLKQSLIAVGNGGLTGVGLGQGQQKAYYIPAAHTDFIFSVIGEELGLLGAGLLLAAFLIVFWRGLRAARRAPDRFGFWLALGLTQMLVLQAFVNMAVCLGLLPTKGLPLPFLSYGGSSLVVSMAAAGLLLNVSQQSN